MTSDFVAHQRVALTQLSTELGAMIDALGAQEAAALKAEAESIPSCLLAPLQLAPAAVHIPRTLRIALIVEQRRIAGIVQAIQTLTNTAAARG